MTLDSQVCVSYCKDYFTSFLDEMIMLQEDPSRVPGSVGDLGWIFGNYRNHYIVFVFVPQMPS